MTFEEFEKMSCFGCGSQRCDPRDIDWLEGCTRFQELAHEDKIQIVADINSQTKKSNY